MQITVDNKYSFDLSDHDNKLDIVQLPDGSYHLIHENISYDVQLLDLCMNTKTMTLIVNGNRLNLKIKEANDELIAKMGFSLNNVQKIKNIKAPMPGLVLDVLTEVGAAVTAGTPLLILEAMKMENVIKASGEGVVKAINVSTKDAIEKGSIMIEME